MMASGDGLQGLSIFLVGMMGAGKTSVGKVLARQLGYHFFDTDVLIEQVAGRTINEIFATEGEAYFRELETKVLAELSSYTQCAIATGGGIILKQMNWSYLRQGAIIWLDVPVDTIVRRLAGDSTRPLLKEANLSEKLSSLLAERRSLYSQADLHIPVEASQTPEEIADRVRDRIPSILKSSPCSSTEQ